MLEETELSLRHAFDILIDEVLSRRGDGQTPHARERGGPPASSCDG